MEQGILIKGIGGFYYVLCADGVTRECKARGKFRSDRLTPMIGDRVTVELQHDGYARLDGIEPRKNELVRPPVANIDQLIIVCAASAPKPDWLLIDKLLISAKLRNIRPLLVLNKLDEREPGVAEAFCADYGRFPHLSVSALTGEGLAPLRERLAGQVSCFAGQSAVGKSSLLNAILPELGLEVGGLSAKTERGRHTTRRAELWPYAGGAILDTPGFSLFDTETVEQAALDACYPEFGDAPKDCRFAGCRHLAEPDCAIKPLVAQGILSSARYERYKALSNELTQRRKHQYD